MTITLGDAVLTYKKRTWHIDGETKGLRYGENPDQPAALYEMESGKLAIDGVEWRGPQGIMSALTEAQMLQAGKHPGKTNLTDVDNGCNILQYLAERPAAVILKHNNPCGIAVATPGAADPIADAHAKAHACDPLSAYGGVIAANRPVTAAMAQTVKGIFTEVIVAPGFEPEALEILREKKNLRLLVLPENFAREAIEYAPFPVAHSSRRLTAYRLRVTTRRTGPWLPVSRLTRQPCVTSSSRRRALRSPKSNAILLADNGAAVGIGMGQVNRVDFLQAFGGAREHSRR